MKASTIQVNLRGDKTSYEVAVGSKLLAGSGDWLSKCSGRKPTKVLIVSNPKVDSLYGEIVGMSLRRAGFETVTHLIGDGESFKNIQTLEDALRVLGENKFTRSDAIVALGGGVVGDLAGLAASIYLRGVPLFQVPTTLLAMIDSSVGGKTAVNTDFGKNLIGTFYQPRGVMIDVDVLGTLEAREVTAGLCEAIKQGAIAGLGLFQRTADLLSRYPVGQFKNHIDEPDFKKLLSELIAEQVKFKARIVQNDVSESVESLSPRSRKILNFGHTLAHALEKVTNYSYLRHGEAVGYGIRFAVALSKSLELLSQDEVDLLNDVVHRAGTLPPLSNIDPLDILEAFSHDKKRVGSSLHWVLLEGIGKPVIVPDTDIPRSAIKSTLKSVLKN